MKKIKKAWILVYKEKGKEPNAYSYDSEGDAKQAEQMVRDSDGEELVNGKEEVVGKIELEWCYVLPGKHIA